MWWWLYHWGHVASEVITVRRRERWTSYAGPNLRGSEEMHRPHGTAWETGECKGAHGVLDEHKLSLQHLTSPQVRHVSLPPWSQGTEGIEELGGLCKWSSLSLRGNAVVEIMCFTQAQADSLMLTRFEV